MEDPSQLANLVNTTSGFLQTITLQYPNSSNMTSSSGGNFKIIRREHMLRQSAQEQINVSWIQSPMLYQYETFEYYDLNQVVNGTNTFFSQEIAISQQRPTQLYLTCMYQGNPYTTQTYASGTTGITLAALNFNNATAGGFRFTEIKVYISGRQNYYLRTAYAQNGQSAYLNGSSGIMKDATNTLESIVNTSTYQNGDESNIAKTKMWTMSEGTFTCISINPGDMQKSSFMSSDQGASVIKMEFYGTDTFGNPIPSTYKIRVYKKLPEMFQIDAQKNITTVIWPAAVSQNKYVIPTTYNLN